MKFDQAIETKVNKDLFNEQIESTRLLLVPISMEYKEVIFNEFTEDITVFMYPRPAESILETENFINQSLTELESGKNLQMVILKKDSKDFLGCAGLSNVNTKTPEMGVWLKKSAHGNNFGKEAMQALKKWADKNLKYEYILYPVAEKNISSQKIPESLGGVIEKKYPKIGLGGNEYLCLEYRIYP